MKCSAGHAAWEMATITFSGGYDDDFVDDPPKYLECSICFLTLRNPTVISCCGNHFCEPCIGRITNNGKPCPLCNSPDFTTLEGPGLWLARGARTSGPPSQPLANSRVYGFVMVECKYMCGGIFERQVIDSHETDDCAKRPIEVQVAFLARNLETLATENRDIRNEVSTFSWEYITEKANRSSITTIQVPFYFSVLNYEQCKKDNHAIMSPPFYSHPKCACKYTQMDARMDTLVIVS